MCSEPSSAQNHPKNPAPPIGDEAQQGWDGSCRESTWWSPDATDLLRGLDRLPLLRQLAFERTFRWICLLLMCVAVGLGIGMAPVWVVTPSGIVPVLRISALDYLDSIEHGRRGERAWERGAVDVALAEWKTALARHPARIRLLRRGLERVASLPAVERRDPRYQAVLGNALWLLRLTRTNRVDADLVVRALDGPCSEAGLMAFLEHLPGRRTPVQRAVGLVAGVRAMGFGEHEPSWPARTGIHDMDRDVEVCRLGWLAAHGDERRAREAWKQLEETSKSGEVGGWAGQIQLWVLAARADLLGYEAVFSWLQRMGADLPVHSVVHWRLLTQCGRPDEARELARRYCGKPVNGGEITLLARAFLALGLEEWAFQFLGRQVSVGDAGLEVWLLYSGELARRGRWEEVSEVAARLRGAGGCGGWQQGLGLYLEGLSRHGRGEGEIARRYFDLASRCRVRPVVLGLELGRRMLELGYLECSLRCLDQYEREFEWDPEYWLCRARAAGGVGNWREVEKSARRRLAIQPGDVLALNDRVTAGLVREEVDEGLLAESRSALMLDPGSAIARLNRARVLIRVGRFAEATAWLTLMDEGEMGTSTLRNRLRAARFELHAGRAEWKRAVEEWARLDLEGMEPVWRERLQGIWRILEIRGLDRVHGATARGP